MTRRHFLAGSSAAMAAALVAPPSLAQSTGPVIKLVFPFGAGGGGDILSRIIAEQIGPVLGRTIIVENRTGADGRTGINAVRTAPPDGNTILLTTGPTMWLMAMVHKAAGFDPFADFEPIAQLALFDLCVAVSNASGIKTVADMAAWVKANPDKATYAIPGAGTIPHFIGVSLSKSIGVEMKRLPYRGGAPAINELVGGHIALSVGTLADALQQHLAGTIRIIASSGAARSAFTPDVPTLKESGFDIVANSWYGLWAPKGTPARLVAELNAAVVAALAKPDIKAKLETMGLVATGTRADALTDIMRENAARWKPVIEASGYQMDN